MKFLRIRNIYYRLIKSNRYPITKKKQLDDKIRLLKDKHLDERCFIVGNGPSLNENDLDLIWASGASSFGANSVYKMFEKTNWRPTYYVLQDQQMIEGLTRYFSDFVKESEGLFVRRDAFKLIDKTLINNNKLYLPRLVMNIKKNNYFDFSDDLSTCAYDGCTVTYLMIQLAYYMGFKEIYLIGIDHNFPLEFDENNNIIKTNQDRFHAFSDNKDIVLNPGRIIESTYAYKSAYIFLSQHDVKIYNATRGGKLEVFPRIVLEDVL